LVIGCRCMARAMRGARVCFQHRRRKVRFGRDCKGVQCREARPGVRSQRRGTLGGLRHGARARQAASATTTAPGPRTIKRPARGPTKLGRSAPTTAKAGKPPTSKAQRQEGAVRRYCAAALLQRMCRDGSRVEGRRAQQTHVAVGADGHCDVSARERKALKRQRRVSALATMGAGEKSQAGAQAGQ
jgi:hypothetical protein